MIRCVKYLLPIITATIALFAVVAFPAVKEAHGYTGGEIEEQISATYKKAQKRQGLSSFHGNCGQYVNNQLYILGINDHYVYGDGNMQFTNYKNMVRTSGGYYPKAYSASKYSLKNALNVISDYGNKNVYNILVGFHSSPTAAGKIYGHTFFIHAIIDGEVYYSECFDYYGSEGHPLHTSISGLAERYSDYGYDGVIYFSRQEVEYERISWPDGSNPSFKLSESLKKINGFEKQTSVILAPENEYCELVSAACFSANAGIPVIPINADSTDAVIDYLKSNMAIGGKIYIIGGNQDYLLNAKKKLSVSADIKALSVSVEQITGNNIYDVNLSVLSKCHVKSGASLMVCGSFDIAEAICAGATGNPVLLVSNITGKLSDAQKDYISKNNFAHIYIVGNNTYISEELEAEISKSCGNIAVERLDNANKYELSLKIAKKFFDAPSSVFFADGKNYADALFCTCITAKQISPVLYLRSRSSTISAMGAYVHNNDIKKINVLGGNDRIDFSILEGIIY